MLLFLNENFIKSLFFFYFLYAIAKNIFMVFRENMSVKNLLKTICNFQEKFNLLKGVIEIGNIVGSVIGLAIFAPEVSYIIVHPTMKALGIEGK